MSEFIMQVNVYHNKIGINQSMFIKFSGYIYVNNI